MNTEEIIVNHVEDQRRRFQLGKYPDIVEKKCNECVIDSFVFASVPGMWHEEINTQRLGISEPFHRASLIEFYNNGNPIWYLVDPTYGQFFVFVIFKNYMFENYNDFSVELLNKGYVPCNFENMLCYINGFVLSGAYAKDINKDEVYKNLEQLLLSIYGSDREIMDTKKRLIELLKLRQQLLEQKNKEVVANRGLNK